MTWQDRLKEAAYTPAQGDRFTFLYTDVSRNFQLRGSAFDFPDADGTFVQRTGNTGRRYPLRVMFSGDNHDLEADAFELALRASGVGLLEHPRYGAKQVVPFGDVNQRDDLVTAANQTVFEVTFWDTVDTVYPTSQSDPGGTVLTALDEYNAQAATELDETADLSGAVEQATFKSQYQGLLDFTSAGLEDIADATTEVSDQFKAINDSINQSIDVLVQDPLTLAFQTTQLIQAPARSAAAITDRLNAYNNLANIIITGDNAVVTPSVDSTASNSFHSADLYVSTYVSGAVLSVVNNTFSTRGEALGSAENILDLMGAVTAWRDDNYESLGETDTGGQYQQLQEAVALAAGFLVEISFTLKQERSLVLTRNRTPIDLCAELYKDIDEVLDFFASSNNLSWQEHLEIPAGRKIVYFV